MKKTAIHAVLDKVAGERPGAPRSVAVAASAGVATAVIVYRVLRHEPDSD